jgi:hypothetical protein
MYCGITYSGVRPARRGALWTGGAHPGAWRRWSSLRAERGAHSSTLPFPDAGDDMSEPPTGGFDAARTFGHGVDS